MRHSKVLFLLLGFLFLSFSNAYASLLITPLQVVMEGRDRSAQIILVNNGDRTNTYRLMWEQFVQVDGLGGYARIEEAEKYNVIEPEGTRHLMDFAVFTPRQITLAPGEKQVVRIAVRRPADLAEGEHKSHLKFQVMPNTTGVVDYEDPNLGNNEMKIGARVNASFSIPVIYRVGEYDAQVKIGQPSFKTNEKTGKLLVEVPLSRTGKHGVIGQVSVFFKPQGGEEALIGSLDNASLFPEAKGRVVTVPTGVNGLNPGVMRIVYKKAEGQVSDYVVMDELVLPVSN